MTMRKCPNCGARNYSHESDEDWKCCKCGAVITKSQEGKLTD